MQAPVCHTRYTDRGAHGWRPYLLHSLQDVGDDWASKTPDVSPEGWFPLDRGLHRRSGVMWDGPGGERRRSPGVPAADRKSIPQPWGARTASADSIWSTSVTGFGREASALRTTSVPTSFVPSISTGLDFSPTSTSPGFPVPSEASFETSSPTASYGESRYDNIGISYDTPAPTAEEPGTRGAWLWGVQLGGSGDDQAHGLFESAGVSVDDATIYMVGTETGAVLSAGGKIIRSMRGLSCECGTATPTVFRYQDVHNRL